MNTLLKQRLTFRDVQHVVTRRIDALVENIARTKNLDEIFVSCLEEARFLEAELASTGISRWAAQRWRANAFREGMRRHRLSMLPKILAWDETLPANIKEVRKRTRDYFEIRKRSLREARMAEVRPFTAGRRVHAAAKLAGQMAGMKAEGAENLLRARLTWHRASLESKGVSPGHVAADLAAFEGAVRAALSRTMFKGRGA